MVFRSPAPGIYFATCFAGIEKGVYAKDFHSVLTPVDLSRTRVHGDAVIRAVAGLPYSRHSANRGRKAEPGGHPHSDALHVIERFRRPDFGHMEVQVTIDDPKAYIKPWTAKIQWEYMPDTELLDWVCENEKDFQHLVGK